MFTWIYFAEDYQNSGTASAKDYRNYLGFSTAYGTTKIKNAEAAELFNASSPSVILTPEPKFC